MNSAILRLLSVCLLALACIAAAQDPLESLMDRARLRREMLHGIRMRVLTEQSSSRPASALSLDAIDRDIVLDLMNDRYAISRTAFVAGSDEPMAAQFAHDGDVYDMHIPKNALGFVDDGPTIHGRREAGVSDFFLWNPPTPEGIGIDDGSLESLLAHGVLRDEMEIVGDRRCYVVDAEKDGISYATVWLDPERDLLPARLQTYGYDGSVRAEAEILDAAAFPTGSGGIAWIPLRWRHAMRIGGHLYEVTSTADGASIEVNPQFEPGDFRIDFPPGTLIQDRVSNTFYKISDSGEWEEQAPRDPESTARMQAAFERAAGDRSVRVHAPDFAAPRASPDAGAMQDEHPGQEAADEHVAEMRTSMIESPAQFSSEKGDAESVDPAVQGVPIATPRAVPHPGSVSAPSTAVRFVLLLSAGILLVLAACWLILRQGARRQSVAHWAWSVALATGLVVVFVMFISRAAIVPAPIRVAPAAVAGTTGAESAAVDALRYTLNDGETIRYVSNPTYAERVRLFEADERGVPAMADMTISLTVLWDGRSRISGAEFGAQIVPRSLEAVLTRSLGIPAHQFVGLERAKLIPLPGDWVLRPGADVSLSLAYISRVIREKGGPPVSFEQVSMEAPVYVLCGAPRPSNQVVRLLTPFPGIAEQPVCSGPFDRFVEALSKAIVHPIENETGVEVGFTVNWIDNSPAHLQLGRPPADSVIDDLMLDIENTFGISIERRFRQRTLWRIVISDKI